MQSSALTCYLVPLKPIYSPHHRFSKTLSLRSSLNESDQVSHPDNTTGKIIRIGGRSSTCNLRMRHAVVTVRTYHWSVNDRLVNFICVVYLCALFKTVCLDLLKQFNFHNIELRTIIVNIIRRHRLVSQIKF